MWPSSRDSVLRIRAASTRPVELDFCKVGDLAPRPMPPIGIVTDIDTVQDLARAEALLVCRSPKELVAMGLAT